MGEVTCDPALAPLRAHAPEVHETLEAALAAVRDALPPGMPEGLLAAVERALGDTTATPALDPALIALVDQFVVYVPGVTDADRAAAEAALEPHGVTARTFVEALYAVDQAARQRRVHARLATAGGPDPIPAEPRPTVEPPPLGMALRELHAAAMRLPEIDPVLTELVRLRCAHHHDCHL